MTQDGMTLIELLVSIVIIGIISTFAGVRVVSIVENAKLNTDRNTVFTLNTATNYYAYNEDMSAFNADSVTDEERLNLLYNTGYTNQLVEVSSRNASFLYSPESRSWSLTINGQTVALTPLGSTLEDIVPSMITLIKDYALDHSGSYGRSWGDYRYTDLGLDPDDWDDPVDHIYYTPSGSTIRLSPEDNYTMTIDTVEGDTKTLTASLNWDIIYNAIDDKWYFHSIDPNNEIIYDTLSVSPS